MYNKSDVNSSPYESNILLIIIYHLNQNLEQKFLKLVSSVTDGEIYIRHPTPHIQMIVSYFNLITMFTLYIYIYILDAWNLILKEFLYKQYIYIT